MTAIRLAVDIGGTFTDVAIENATATGSLTTAKVLTTPDAPEKGVIAGINDALAQVGINANQIKLIVHGTTLATNAILERKGARTALITTDGFRDVLAIGYENRFDQYDIFIEKPSPLVPRSRRFTVPERVDIHGQILRPLDESAVGRLVDELTRHDVESVAIGFLHAYANPQHEQRTARIIAAALPQLTVSLSSEVCPEVREYERMSTTVANAYVRPLMASYLGRLQVALNDIGALCPVLLMTSGGGLTALETARQFPIRLVESGPAGGAILASCIAEELALKKVISFDMGGTTAKICLIDDAQPQSAREFEVDRAARFIKGSGLPLRIPVIEMVEIGAGGGSIARLDSLQRITIGPDSAGADPGPAAYAQGGEQPTVTDADVALGKIDPARFAGGKMHLDEARAQQALQRVIGEPLGLTLAQSAYGVAEMVDETMANAARVHAVERGKTAAEHTLVAFGGAAPLHVCRLAEKLNIDRVIIPVNAGVGSAVGFLRAPVAYEVVRSRSLRLAEFNAGLVNQLFEAMRAEALPVVAAGSSVSGKDSQEINETRSAYMRYVGQGHEILVELPSRELTNDDAALIADAFALAYRALYHRTIPNGEIEILTWTLGLSSASNRARIAATPISRPATTTQTPPAIGERPLLDPTSSNSTTIPLYWRSDLGPAALINGPAIIAEDATSTFVSNNFDAWVADSGHLILDRR